MNQLKRLCIDLDIRYQVIIISTVEPLAIGYSQSHPVNKKRREYVTI
jgi:hypothetical protein